MVCCFSTDKLYAAQMAQELLASNGIDSIILNKQDSVFLVGDIEVLVRHELLIRAKHLLKDFEV
ncbi:MAG: DUF2007 domain-containing protein [Bacteroidales bacterium]|nr:DUF2007 domain-containing protein [Bacteroidales bacterium]